MNKIPVEIDQLMWEIAESQSQDTIEEFVRRFPDFRHELTKRLNMVQSLRGARPTGAVPAAPAFRVAAPAAGASWATVAAAFGLVAVGFGSYWAALQAMTPGSAEPASIERPMRASDRDAMSDRQRTYQQEAIVEEGAPSTPPKSEAAPGAASSGDGEAISVFHRPINLAIDDAPLLDVLQMVSDASKLKLTIGPMMPNPKVSVAYHQQSALSVLDDLGRQYGFAVFEQEAGRVLIVPDSKRQDTGETGQ